MLCKCVRLQGVGFDACAGTGNISRYVKALCPKVREVRISSSSSSRCSLSLFSLFSDTQTLVGMWNVLKIDGVDVDPMRAENVDFVMDALTVKLKPHCYQFVIFSPPFLLSDIFLTWALEQPVDLWCFHLAGDYWTNGPEYRVRALKTKMDTGLVLFISGLPVVPGRGLRRCMWIVIFANARVRTRTLVKSACCQVYMNSLENVAT